MREFKLFSTFVLLALLFAVGRSAAMAQDPLPTSLSQRRCEVNISSEITLTPERPMRLQIAEVNQDCTVKMGPVMDVTQEQLRDMGLIGEPDPRYESRVFRPPDEEPTSGSSGVAEREILTTTSSTCHGFQRMVDVIGLMLTQIEAITSWSWDGSNVLSTSNRQVIATWLPDGWRVTDGPYGSQYGPTLPAQYQHWAGWGSFSWIGGSYPHTHNVRDTVWYNGDCSVTGSFSGSIVPGGSVYYGGWVTTP